MFIKELRLPTIPIELEYQIWELVNATPVGYQWITVNSNLKDWCNQNICPSTHWGVQLIKLDLPLHRDAASQVKINYLLDTGGDAVTNFYDNDKLIDTVICKPRTWYIMKTDQLHEVLNITGTRVSLAGKVFP